MEHKIKISNGVKIVKQNNKVLRQKAKEVPITEVKTKKIKDVIKEMSNALFAVKNGVALAAPQIGESLRIFIIDRDYNQKEKTGAKKKKQAPIVFINPIIKKISKEKQVVSEGCLSVEGIYGVIKRADKIKVSALDASGKKFILGASGLLAQIIQHEMDHLEGILFVDKALHLEKITSN